MKSSAASTTRRPSSSWLVLGCSLVLGGSIAATAGLAQPQPQGPAAAPAPAANPAAEARGKEIVELINSGDRQAIEAYARDNIEQGAARGPFGPMPAADLLMKMHYESRGATLVGFRPTSPTAVTARYRNAMLGMTGAVNVEVSPQAPHKIVQLAPRRPSPSVDVPPGTDAERVAQIDAVLKRMSDNDYFSGVMLIAKNGKPIFERAYGMANREKRVPNTLDTRFNLASMNKMFTAVAIAQLVEQGKLSYEDPVSKFLPDYPDPESAQKIKIKHLVTHTSGLDSYFGPKFFSRPMTEYRTIGAYLDAARQPGLAFEPGTRWFYSNTGMLVAGRIVEIASGQDYYDYVRQHIYKPAGMTRTDSYELDKQPDRAIGYDAAIGPDGVSIRNTDNGTPVRGSPAGGGFSTARDVLRFANAFQANKLVGKAMTEGMLTPHPELGAPNYGYGLDLGGRLAPPGRKIAGHPGDSPGTCAIFDMIRDTPEPYTVIILTNGNSMGNCQPVAQLAYSLFAPAKN